MKLLVRNHLLHKYSRSGLKDHRTTQSNTTILASDSHLLARTIRINIRIMSDLTSNQPTRLSNTVNIGKGVSELTAHISKLEAVEDRTRDIINRISSILHDILEPQSNNVNEKQKVGAKQKNSQKQKVSEKRIELAASIKTLNNIREHSRYGYSILYTLWKQMGDVQGEDENEEIAGQVRKLNWTPERNRQEIVALWRKLRDLHREGVKLTGDKGLVGCKAGKGGTSGVAWGHVLRVFSGMESNV